MSADNPQPLIDGNSGAEANQSTGTGWRWVLTMLVIVAAVGAWWYYLDGRCQFGSTPRDCAGKCGGDAVVDCEGTCGGTAGALNDAGCCGELTKDCEGTCGGTAGAPNDAGCCGELTKDCADKCGGVLVVDCEGTCGGTAGAPNDAGCCGELTKDCEGTCGGVLVVDCEGTCGGTALTCPSSVFLNETWNNGTKTLSGTYVRDGTHNSKPVYKRSEPPGGMYIFYATGLIGAMSTECWVLLDKIQDNEEVAIYSATPTRKGISEQDLTRVEFMFHNGLVGPQRGWVVPDPPIAQS